MARLRSAKPPASGGVSLWITLAPLVPVAAYLWLGSRALLLPGVHYDELLGAAAALAALVPIDGPIVRVEGSVLHIADHPFPLFIMPYMGAVQASLLALSFTVAGVSVPVIRWTFLLLGTVPLLLTYAITRRLLGGAAAIIATALLAVDPTYVFGTRSDFGPVLVIMICRLGILWLLARWWRSARLVFLLGAAFVAGVGLYDRFNSLWFLLALPLTGALLYWHALRDRMVALAWRARVAVLAAFCLGCLPVIVYAAASGGGPLRGLGALVQRPTGLGVDNTQLLANFGHRIASLHRLLEGYEILDLYSSTFDGQTLPYERGLWPSTLLPYLLGATVIVCAAAAVVGITTIRTRILALLLLLTALMVVATVVTPTNLSYNHLLGTYPFPHMAVAGVLGSLPRLWRSRGGVPTGRRFDGAVLGQILRGIIVAAALASSIGVISVYHRVLAETGGAGAWSDAIYELASHLRGERRRVVSMDWGINLNLLVLSNGALRTGEAWLEFLYTREASPDMQRLIETPDQLFVFHSAKYAGVLAASNFDGPRQTFFRTLDSMGARAVLERRFHQRNGEPVLELYSVAR